MRLGSGDRVRRLGAALCVTVVTAGVHVCSAAAEKVTLDLTEANTAHIVPTGEDGEARGVAFAGVGGTGEVCFAVELSGQLTKNSSTEDEFVVTSGVGEGTFNSQCENPTTVTFSGFPLTVMLGGHKTSSGPLAVTIHGCTYQGKEKKGGISYRRGENSGLGFSLHYKMKGAGCNPAKIELLLSLELGAVGFTSSHNGWFGEFIP